MQIVQMKRQYGDLTDFLREAAEAKVQEIEASGQQLDDTSMADYLRRVATAKTEEITQAAAAEAESRAQQVADEVVQAARSQEDAKVTQKASKALYAIPIGIVALGLIAFVVEMVRRRKRTSRKRRG